MPKDSCRMGPLESQRELVASHPLAK
jgi:hypothetical protein